MQHAGTVRKRKRRNISKVIGLSTIKYDEKMDTYDGSSLFRFSAEATNKSVLGLNQTFTAIPMNSSAWKENRIMLSNSQRVTRDPNFHLNVLDNSEIIDMCELAGNGRLQSAWSKKSSTGFLIDNGVFTERSHFLDKTTMNRLRNLIRLGTACGALPWKWNAQQYTIDKWRPQIEKIWKVAYYMFVIQTAFLTFFQVYSFVKQYKETTHESYRGTFMTSFAVCWYIYVLYFSLNLMFYRDRIRHYINTMLQFNKEYVNKYLIHLDDFQDGDRIIMNITIPTNSTQPFVCVLFFLVMPYQPWYLFSYIHPKPWYWLIPGAIHEFILVGNAAVSFLTLSWLTVSHCNVVGFWLTETHNSYASDYTTDELRQPKTSIETYKALQILCQLFNECMAPMAIPTLKITVFTALISCGYVLIRSMNHVFFEELPGILTYPLAVLDTFTVGFGILTLAAQMHDLASSYIDSWSRTKHKGFRRLLMSLPSLKVRVGRFYFITVATTIAFFKVVFDLITDAIITFP